MSAKPFPTGRDPLLRLGPSSLIITLGGLGAIVFAIVKQLQSGENSVEWLFGLGMCLIIIGAVTAQIQIVLLGHRARIEALEKRKATNPQGDNAS
jgi:hypothetical protein